MSLDSLFQHILFTEQQAKEKRRLMHQIKLETNGCHAKIKAITEELVDAKADLELKVQHLSDKLFYQQLLKKREDALEDQKDKLMCEKRELLTTFENLERAVAEEQEKFMNEICEFNNAYGLTSNREILIQKRIKGEICDLEREASALRQEMEKMEHENVHLSALHLQKISLMEELFDLQQKLKGIEDDLSEAVETTKHLEAKKIKINQKPQSDPECLRLKSGLEICRDDDLDQVYEALRTEVEFLQMKLSRKALQMKK